MQLEVCGILGKTEKLAQPLFPLLPAFPQNLFWLFQQFQLHRIVTWQWWRLKLTRVSILESLPKFRARAPPLYWTFPIKWGRWRWRCRIKVMDIWISATSNKEGCWTFHLILYLDHQSNGYLYQSNRFFLKVNSGQWTKPMLHKLMIFLEQWTFPASNVGNVVRERKRRKAPVWSRH